MKQHGNNDFPHKAFGDYSDMPRLDDEVRGQEQEVFRFRSVERFMPEERSYE